MAEHEDAEMRARYDFSKGARGKHKDRFPPGSSFSVIDLDLLEKFSSPQAVNDALRAYLKMREGKADHVFEI